MSVEEIKALVRRIIEEINKGKVAAMAAMDELIAADFVFHSHDPDIRGLDGFKQRYNEIFNSFPDFRLIIDDMVVEGDKVATRWTMICTLTGEWRGIPPTNKKATIWGISIDRIAGGKFVEEWEMFDSLSLIQQLGILPTPEKGK